MSGNTSLKVSWQGEIISIQPKTRVWRYITDNRTHYHLGYNLFIVGESSDGKQQFTVAISETQHLKRLFRSGNVVEGTAWTKQYAEREFADYYKVGALKIINRADNNHEIVSPPWITIPPAMEVYEKRGARLLSKSLWKTKCYKCIWANMANVEIQWDFDKNIKKYRFETFCYGPISCKFYKMGRPRSVPYKNRVPAIDNGWLDDICIESRDED